MRRSCLSDNQRDPIRCSATINRSGAHEYELATVDPTDTRTAKDLTPDSVLAAIRVAENGDTLQLPAGTSVCSKGWNTSTWLAMKAITIQGAGIDRTNIIDDTNAAGGD
jgi:hypothetical protein